MMKSYKSKITTRVATPNDTHELCELLNEIIVVGGTTAIETQLTDSEFGEYFLHGKNFLCCFVAVDDQDSILGFQALERRPEIAEDWADIATFARLSPKFVGVGTALFAQTLLYVKQTDIIALNATIRADNKGGLAYYEKMGFRTYSVSRGIPLANGTTIDRISKRFNICVSTK